MSSTLISIARINSLDFPPARALIGCTSSAPPAPAEPASLAPEKNRPQFTATSCPPVLRSQCHETPRHDHLFAKYGYCTIRHSTNDRARFKGVRVPQVRRCRLTGCVRPTLSAALSTMSKKLSPHQLNMLRQWEPKLRAAVRGGDAKLAEGFAKRIQGLFTHDRDHHRVLRAKNWYYECLIDVGRAEEAKAGLEAVRARASEHTRVYLEASSLLAVCCIRLQLIEEAKEMLRLVIQDINSIASPARRHQFQERLLERIEDEVILSQLVGRSEGSLEPDAVHQQAVALIQSKSEQEIYELIGSVLPLGTPFLLKNVREYAFLLLPVPDQKLLQPPREALPKQVIGKKAAAALKRIGWRTLCDPESELYRLWKEKIPIVFEKGYFAAAITTTLAQWRIGIPQLAVGVAAVAMRFGCQEFCDAFRPEGLMIARDDKG